MQFSVIEIKIEIKTTTTAVIKNEFGFCLAVSDDEHNRVVAPLGK